MGFIENANPPMAAFQVRRIAIAGSVDTIGYQMEGSATLGVVRTSLECFVSKSAIGIAVD